MGIFGRLTRTVRLLIIINILVYILDYLLGGELTGLLGLTPREAVMGFKVWQFFTYMFVHSQQNLGHLVFNMLALWMFGGPVEDAMGSRKFIRYYFITGLGAALFVCIFSWNSLSIGASGAIYGLLVAFGMLFPDALVLVFFIFPMRAKYFVILFAVIELFVTITTTGSGIAHFAHIGGLVTGYLYLKYNYKLEEMYTAARNYKTVKTARKVMPVKEQRTDESPRENHNLEEHVDSILDKINKSGLQSLSSEEHAMLQKASERLRERDEKVVDLKQYRERYR
ncbi:MAG: rhomboid family intramembrane serine protease [Candidatus Eremiobacteraeota bacterium]|nr:rhomboid family intramembrane serine protease [Candidatus Eremiobacteraeota bacterium]